jgi:hypothetical protein
LYTIACAAPSSGPAIPRDAPPASPASPVRRLPQGGTLQHLRNDAGRVAYLPADLDRRYAEDGLPDHAALLANLARSAAGGPMPLEVTGPGTLDCHLYRQPGRLILHLVNLSGTRGGIVEESLPVGPFRVRLRLPEDVPGRQARLLVAVHDVSVTTADGWPTLEVPRVTDHEVGVVE